MTSKSVGRAAAVVSVSILLSRMLGYVRDLVLGALLGATGNTDVYVAAFAIPDILFYLMAGGYLTITFIPILSRYLAADDETEAWRAFTAVAIPVGLGAAALTTLGIVFAEPLARFAFTRIPSWLPAGDELARLSTEQLDQVVSLTRIVMPAQFFFLVGSLLMAVQYSRQRFLVPALAPLVYNLAIIVGGVISWAFQEASPVGFIWGALAGAILGNFVLQVWGARRSGLHWVRGGGLRHPAVGEYLILALPLMLGQSIAVLDEWFVRIFGPLAGQGATAELYFARRLNMLPVGVIAQAAAVAAYPFIARLLAEGKLAEMRATMQGALKTTLSLGVLASAALIASAQPLVRVLFQRAEFDQAATSGTSAALAVFALTVPLWAAHQLYSRGFYALRRMWTPVLVGTAWTAVAVPLYPALIARLGAPGLAWASVVTIAGYTLTLGVIWHRSQGGGAGPIFASVFKALVVAALAGFAAWLAMRALTTPASGSWPTLGALIAGAGAFAGIAWPSWRLFINRQLAR